MNVERDLTPTRIALNRLRLSAFNAFQGGATCDQVNAAVAEAKQIYDRTGHRGTETRTTTPREEPDDDA
jgi:S-adenosylmethionine:diacylglycerol 3-amino-3-carboxypropyl transferase